MSWVDWVEMLLLKDTTGRYLFGDPSAQKAPSVWGRPVVPTNTMTVGNFLTGAFQLSAALWDREQATVRISEHHANFFVQNMVAILGEERVVADGLPSGRARLGLVRRGGRPAGISEALRRRKATTRRSVCKGYPPGR
jgi:hypothetical protein